MDRELYLPKAWAADAARRAEAHVPEQVAFHTKPQLALQMLVRAVEAGVPAGWVTADEVYGGDARLRAFLEDRDLAGQQLVGELQHPACSLAGRLPGA